MSRDVPLSLVFASCPAGQVAPLVATLAQWGHEPTCGEHWQDPSVVCLPLGRDGIDAEFTVEEVHQLHRALLEAAPQAGFAVIGGPSESGPGVLRMNHPRLGDFRADVHPEDSSPSPLFSVAQITAILASSAHRPDAALQLHLALGRPWAHQFDTIAHGCQVATGGMPVTAAAAAAN